MAKPIEKGTHVKWIQRPEEEGLKRFDYGHVKKVGKLTTEILMHDGSTRLIVTELLQRVPGRHVSK